MLASKHTALAIVLAGLGVAGCREKPRDPQPPPADGEPADPEPSADAPKAPPAEPARCREVRAGSLFSVGDAGKRELPTGVDDAEDEDPIAMPFAAELGSAVGFGGGFAVGVLQAQQRGQRVSAAVLGADGSGRLIEIGTVHGDVEPPVLTVLGERLVVLHGDSDAGGAVLRTALVGPGADKAVPGPELVGVERDAGAGLLAVGGEIVVAFSRAQKGKPRLSTARFRPGASEFSAPEMVAAQAAESPHLAARPGGAWLAWIEQHPLPEAVKKRAAADAGDEEPGGLETGPRSLRIVGLDAQGKPSGAPLALTKNDSHVLAFELAPWPDGGAVVAWRDDPTAPGVEGGSLHLAHVKPDGTTELGALDDAELGAGVPSLLVDPAPRAPGTLVWLAAGGGNETTRFGLLTGSGTNLTPLAADKLLGTAELIGVHGGVLLAARPRGTARELYALECQAGP
jgi:hypothetical protein